MDGRRCAQALRAGRRHRRRLPAARRAYGRYRERHRAWSMRAHGPAARGMISVCVPTYNRAASLAEALASAQAQTVRDIEILVVDNASTDGTRDIVADKARGDSRIRYVRQAQNVGITRNFTTCITEARGELVKFLCDDDLLEPQCTEMLARSLAQPGVSLAACARRMLGDSAKVLGVRRQSTVIDGRTMIR